MITTEQYLLFSPYFAAIDTEKKEGRIQFLKVFEKAPQSIRNLITSTETIEKIVSACELFHMDKYDIEGVSYSIRKIALAEIPITTAVRFIASETELSTEQAQNLLGTILRDIFSSAIEDIKKIQHEKYPELVQKSLVSQSKTPPHLKIPAPPTDINEGNIVDLRNPRN